MFSVVKLRSTQSTLTSLAWKTSTDHPRFQEAIHVLKKMKMLINHRYNVVLIVVADRCHWLLVMLVLMVINVDELTCS